jgi:uncharacterized protein
VLVVADTNILVSGLNFPAGKPNQLLELARAGEIDLAISDAILDETADVLARKFDWPDADVREMRRQFGLFARKVFPEEKLNAVPADPDDNAILECASTAGADYMISGDHHLLELGKFREIPIVKVAEFLEMLKRGRGR